MKKVIIKITGSQTDDVSQSPEEVAEFTTEGQYACADGSGSFSYLESELTGMAGTRTTIVFTPEDAVLTREGAVNSRMYFVRGQKNTFLYDTPYGTATVGLETQRYRSTLAERGGELEIGYVVDFDHAFVGQNQLKIQITEQKG